MWTPTREPFPVLAISGYLAFTAATMLAVIASEAGSNPPAVGLLAVALPALAPWLYIQSIGWAGPEPATRHGHRGHSPGVFRVWLPGVPARDLGLLPRRVV